MTGSAYPPARCIFKSDAVRHAVDTKGYAKLAVLGNHEIEELAALFLSFTGGVISNSQYGMYVSVNEHDVIKRRALLARLYEVLLPILARHFSFCRPILASFLVKAPEEYSYTYPHQDWTFVDPPHRSVTVWLALTDITEQSGAMGFIDGSHRLFRRPVGSPLPEFQTITQGHESLLYEYLRFVPLRAGEAIVFDTSVIHGSGSNTSSSLRSAVAIGLTPSEAQLYHHILTFNGATGSKSNIAKIAVDRRFFENHTATEIGAICRQGLYASDHEILASQPNDFTPITASSMRHLCEALGAEKNGKRVERPPRAKKESSHRVQASSLLGNRHLRAWMKQRAKTVLGKLGA